VRLRQSFQMALFLSDKDNDKDKALKGLLPHSLQSLINNENYNDQCDSNEDKEEEEKQDL